MAKVTCILVCVCVLFVRCLSVCFWLAFLEFGGLRVGRSNLLTSPLKNTSFRGTMCGSAHLRAHRPTPWSHRQNIAFSTEQTFDPTGDQHTNPHPPLACFTPLLVFYGAQVGRVQQIWWQHREKIYLLRDDTYAATNSSLSSFKRQRHYLCIYGVTGFIGPENEAIQPLFWDLGTTCLLLLLACGINPWPIWALWPSGQQLHPRVRVKGCHIGNIQNTGRAAEEGGRDN